jgi:hypothetical protein
VKLILYACEKVIQTFQKQGFMGNQIKNNKVSVYIYQAEKYAMGTMYIYIYIYINSIMWYWLLI